MALTRRTLAIGLAGAAGLLAWRCRLLQVGAFLTATAARQWLHPDKQPDFRALLGEWQTLRSIRKYAESGSRGLITYHPWYHQFRPSTADRCLQAARELGAGFIRLDIRWKDVFPDGEKTNEAAWDWYKSYLTAARERYALRPILVLSNPSDQVLSSPIEFRRRAWREYVEQVRDRFGPMCELFQVLNEPNNPAYKIFPGDNTAEVIRETAAILRSKNPHARITINVLVDLPGWREELERILRESQDAIDVVGIDFYPGTWTLSSQSVSSLWNRLCDEIIDARENRSSPLYKRQFAILETGYSTNLRSYRDESKQQGYFRDLSETLIRWEEKNGRDGLVWIGIHELTDSDTRAGLDPEAHFGLLTSDILVQKPSFSVVQQLFARL